VRPFFVPVFPFWRKRLNCRHIRAGDSIGHAAHGLRDSTPPYALRAREARRQAAPRKLRQEITAHSASSMNLSPRLYSSKKRLSASQPSCLPSLVCRERSQLQPPERSPVHTLRPPWPCVGIFPVWKLKPPIRLPQLAQRSISSRFALARIRQIEASTTPTAAHEIDASTVPRAPWANPERPRASEVAGLTGNPQRYPGAALQLEKHSAFRGGARHGVCALRVRDVERPPLPYLEPSGSGEGADTQGHR
jgi:hypothetical protein